MSSSTLVKEKTQSAPRRRNWLLAWLPVLVWLLIIALESSEFLGANHTSGPLRKFFEIFHGPFTFSQWWLWHRMIRKTGHVLGYGILSGVLFRAFWMTFRLNLGASMRRFSGHLLALAGTFMVASLDEFHQTFLPNRTGLFSDVLIDLGGAVAVQILILSWMQARPRQ